ncbi:hypothetical protein GGI35DRAFT_485072 [Trichoderma velutinum]
MQDLCLLSGTSRGRTWGWVANYGIWPPNPGVYDDDQFDPPGTHVTIEELLPARILASEPYRMCSRELSQTNYGDNRRESVAVEGEELVGRLGDESTAGSLKRSAVMAESKRHKTKGTCIDFGCNFPLSSDLPAELERRLK